MLQKFQNQSHRIGYIAVSYTHLDVYKRQSEPSAEALLAAQPDFIIASAKTAADVDLMPTLEDAGIPTAYFDVSTFEDYREMLEICTRITGREDLYQQHGVEVGEQVQATIDSAAGKQGPTVLYLRASGSLSLIHI